MKKDDFGDRMKSYEAMETNRRLDISLPIYARLDGRGFSKFTKGMDKPFSVNMTRFMETTASYLVEKTKATAGFVQSDEISLVWDTYEQFPFFDAKVQKMTSVLAGMATAKFNSLLIEGLREKLPHFDCRVLNLPSKTEAANMFLWRAMDAKKNAVASIAQYWFSHKDLQNKSQKDMIEMLREKGIVLDRIFHEKWLYGSFVRKRTIEKNLTSEELNRIPIDKRPDGPVMRNEFYLTSIKDFHKVKNRIEFLFDGDDYVYEDNR
jgi:tRNA(His) guanylyltransferase